MPRESEIGIITRRHMAVNYLNRAQPSWYWLWQSFCRHCATLNLGFICSHSRLSLVSRGISRVGRRVEGGGLLEIPMLGPQLWPLQLLILSVGMRSEKKWYRKRKRGRRRRIRICIDSIRKEWNFIFGDLLEICRPSVEHLSFIIAPLFGLTTFMRTVRQADRGDRQP